MPPEPRQLSLFDSPSLDTRIVAPTTLTRDPDSALRQAISPYHDTPAPALPGYRRHALHLSDGPLNYALRRSRRRTIGLSIRDAQLLIQAPSWATQTQIEEIIHEKSRWIRDKIKSSQERLALLALQDTQWCAGGRIPYLGVMIELQLDGAQDAWFDGDSCRPEAGDRLHLPLPENTDTVRIQERAQVWLRARATEDFERRLQAALNRAGQHVDHWGLSGAQGRWGSCTSRRRIRLNWRLIHLPPMLIEYVVAHEVAHLKEMNHSPAFWREVEKLYPGFKQARDALAQHHPASLPLF